MGGVEYPRIGGLFRLYSGFYYGGSVAWLDAAELVEGWHIILCAGLISFISGFDWPTRQAIFLQLIERDDMMSAVALNSIMWQSSRMVMPAIGGLLLSATGVGSLIRYVFGGLVSGVAPHGENCIY